MSEYGYMKHLFWNYRLYFIQIDFGFVSCYVICFSSIFLDLKYFQFNITVCLISFEYKRTAVKFSSGHYLSVFCSFLWVLPSLYGTLHSPIVWNLKPNQLCIISVTHSLQGCWGSCPGNRVITMLWRGLKCWMWSGPRSAVTQDFRKWRAETCWYTILSFQSTETKTGP